MGHLESRVCFSGTPIDISAATDPNLGDAFAAEEQGVFERTAQADVSAEDSRGVSDETAVEVVFIDESVDGREQVELALERKFGDRALIYTLDRSQDGIQQISDTLMHLEGIEAIHIVSHGEDGAVCLGNGQLNSETLTGYSGQIAAWGASMTSGADVLFYGCDLAATQDGRGLLEAVQALTGADLAASDDATGHASLGGDWDLEVAIGDVDTDVAFDMDFQRNWKSLLAILPITSTVTVTTTGDVNDGDTSSITALLANRGVDGEISLREAILAANNTSGHDAINLGPGTYELKIADGADGSAIGADGDFDITDHISILGADAATTIIDAQGTDRVFDVAPGVSAIFNDLTITGGMTSDQGGALYVDIGADAMLERVNIVNNQSGAGGGGIYVENGQLTLHDVLVASNTATGQQGGGLDNHGGIATVSNTTFAYNIARDGGGINNDGGSATLTLNNVTISGNSATNDGGGLRTREAVDITSSTIFGNSASTLGGGIEVGGSGGSVTVYSSILDGNLDGTSDGNIEGSASDVNSLGFNLVSDNSSVFDADSDLIGVSASLGALQNNGGFAVTHTLLAGSAAIDAGGQENISATDANGTTRDYIADIGAVESTQAAVGKLFWIDTDTDTIVRADADGSPPQTVLSGLTAPRGLTVDAEGGRIYWTDGNDDVMSANLDGSDVATVTSGITNVLGITVDSVNQQLFVVEGDFFGSDRIWRVNFDGSGLVDVISDAGIMPTDVEVDAAGGKIYYVDRGGIAGADKIYRANLDGSNKEVIVDNTIVDGPMALDLDLSAGKLYWLDQNSFGNDRMMRANLDGSGVEVLQDQFGADLNAEGVLSITVDSLTGDLFWTDPGNDQIVKLSGTTTTPLIGSVPGPSDIEFVHVSSNPSNQDPTADAGGTYNVIEGQSVTLDATASTDNDGTIVNYEWDFDYDGSFDVSATGVSPDFDATGIDGPTTRTIALRVTDDQGGQAIATTTVTVTNAPPVAVDDSDTTSENASVVIDPLANDFDPSSADAISLSSITAAPSQGTATINATSNTITFDPGSDFNDLAAGETRDVTIGYSIVDDDGDTASASITVTVVGENDAPVLTSASPIQLPNILEDSTPSGVTVAQMLTAGGNPIVDADSGSQEGIAVVFADNTNGSWQYSIDGGTNWSTFSVAGNAATLLNETSLVRFVPNQDYFGPSGNLRFRAWDQTVGVCGDTGVSGTGVVNGTGAFSSAMVTARLNVVPVNDAPDAVDDVASVDEGDDVDIAVLANDSDVDNAIDPNSVTIVSGPSNGAVTISGGVIEYTHDGSETVSDSFTYQVSDASGTPSNTATVLISINPQNEDPLAVDDAFSVDEDTVLSVDAVTGVLANDSDPDGNSLSVTLVAGPGNGTLQLQNDGSFDYTPDANFFGADQFTYEVADGEGGVNQATVNLTVNPVDDAPRGALDNLNTNEDTPLTFSQSQLTLNDTDDDGDPLTVSIAAQPSNGAIVDNRDGTFTFTPDPDFNGVTTFAYTVTDPTGLSDTVTSRITVNPQNDAPVATDDSYTLDEDSTLSASLVRNVLLNDSDVDGDALSVRLLADVSNGQLALNSDGTFNYTPNVNFNGQDSFTYQVDDGAGRTDSATVFLNVNPVNDAPVATADSLSTDEEMPLIISSSDLLANDSDVEGDPLAVTITVQPVDGVVTDNGDGTFTFTPNQDFSGLTSFAYSVSDPAGDSSSATVNMLVRPVNDAPQAVLDAFTTAEGATLNGASVLGNDVDVDGDALNAILLSGPTHGALSLNADGTFTYIHNGSETTSDSFTYAARDAQGETSTGTVQITILAVNDTPTATDDFFSLNEGATLTVGASTGALANDFDADSAISGTVVEGPRHGTLQWNPDGSFTYVHNGGESTTDSFRYAVSDSSTAFDEGRVTLQINSVNDAPTAVGENVTMTANSGSFVLTKQALLQNDIDFENDELTIVILQQPANGVVTLQQDGSVLVTPNEGFIGADQFEYAVSDGDLVSNAAVVNLSLVPPQQSTTTQTDPDSEPTEESATETISTTTQESSNSQPAAPPVPAPDRMDEDEDDQTLGPLQTPKSDEIFSERLVAGKLMAESEDSLQHRQAMVSAEAKRIFMEREQAVETVQISIGEHQVAHHLTGLGKQLLDAATLETLVQSFDGMRQELQLTSAIPEVVLPSVVAATSTFSVGYVLWLLRGGYVFATVISSMPAWQSFDPVPILTYADDTEDDDQDDSLESLMEGGNAA